MVGKLVGGLQNGTGAPAPDAAGTAATADGKGALGGEDKGRAALIDNGPLAPLSELGNPTVDYYHIRDIPICEAEGLPPVNDRYLQDVRRVWVMPAGIGKNEIDRAFFLKPGEVGQIEQELRGELKGLGAEVKYVFANPDDQRFMTIQGNRGNFRTETEPSAVDTLLGRRTAKTDFYPCRSEEEDERGGHRIYIHTQNLLLDGKRGEVGPLMECLPTFEPTNMELGRLIASRNFTTRQIATPMGGVQQESHQMCFDTRSTFVKEMLIPAIEQLVADKLLDPERGKLLLKDIKSVAGMTWKDILGIVGAGAGILSGTAFFAWIGWLLWDKVKEKRGGEKIIPQLRNLTAEAKAGRLPKRSMITVERPLYEAMAEFGKTELSNVLFLAENGVGKTATAEAVAEVLSRGVMPDGRPVPKGFEGATVLEVNVKRDIVVGGGRGEYVSVIDSRMQKLFGEAAGLAKKTGRKVVLFIDEMHTIVGAGKACGSTGAEQGVKAALARGGDVLVMGATTHGEYLATIATDPALDSRFGKVTIPTPDGDTTVRVMLDVKESLQEEAGGRTITDDAIREAVLLSRGRTDTNYPRKAFDLLRRVTSERRMARDTRGTIDGEDVRASVVRRETGLMGNLIGAVVERHAGANGVSPEDAARMKTTSIVSGLKAAISNFDQLPEASQGKLIAIVDEAWRKARPELRDSLTPPEMSRHEVPGSFVNHVVEHMRKDGSLGHLLAQEDAPPARPRRGGKSGPKGPAEPPAAPSGDGGGAVGGEGGTSGAGKAGCGAKGGGKPPPVVNRIAVEIEPSQPSPLDFIKGARGIAWGALLLIGVEAAEHYGRIDGAGKGIVLGAWVTGMTIANPAAPAHLALMAPPFEIARIGVESVFDASGINGFGRGEFGNKAAGIVGGLGGAAVAMKYLGGAVAWNGAAQSMTRYSLAALPYAIGYEATGIAFDVAGVENGLVRGVGTVAGAAAVGTGIVEATGGLAAYKAATAAVGTSRFASMLYSADQAIVSAARFVAPKLLGIGRATLALGSRLLAGGSAMFGLFMINPAVLGIDRPDRRDGGMT